MRGLGPRPDPKARARAYAANSEVHHRWHVDMRTR